MAQGKKALFYAYVEMLPLAFQTGFIEVGKGTGDALIYYKYSLHIQRGTLPTHTTLIFRSDHDRFGLRVLNKDGTFHYISV